jgi:hypothetical protein
MPEKCPKNANRPLTVQDPSKGFKYIFYIDLSEGLLAKVQIESQKTPQKAINEKLNSKKAINLDTILCYIYNYFRSRNESDK